MRRVEEGFGESIPAVVKHVYRGHLTIPGEVSLRIATHLGSLLKTLTSSVSGQVAGFVARRGPGKNHLFHGALRKGGFRSRIGSP